MIHGTDYLRMTAELLDAIHLCDIIGDRSKRVALKPNLLQPDTADNGAITHPELVEGVFHYLKEHHFSNVCVMEGAWAGARTSQAVKVSGVEEICQRYMIPFIDLQKDTSYQCDACGMQLNVCSQVAKTDFLINLPVLKGHCQTKITCALKNAKGVIPNSEKRRFHTLGLHKPIAHLNTVLPPQFILADNICGDLNFEEGGNPVVMNRIFACLDPVLCDAYVCECIGYSVDDVPYIRIAEGLGVGSADISHAEFIFLNQPGMPAAPAADLSSIPWNAWKTRRYPTEKRKRSASARAGKTCLAKSASETAPETAGNICRAVRPRLRISYIS